MKLAILLLMLFIAAAPPAAQEVCELTAENAPALQGLRIGMTPEEVQAVFDKDLKIKIKKNGERTFFKNFIKEPAPPSVAGVRAMYLRFFDRRLYQIEIFYENNSEMRTLEDFINNLTATLNLPASAWENARGTRRLSCDKLTFIADNVLNPRIEITDETTRANAELLRGK